MLDIQDAISLLEKREPREAADLLEQMVAEMPAYATARVLLARSYEALNEWDLALSAWQEVLQMLPNSPVIRQGLGRSAPRATGHRARERADERARADEEAGEASPIAPAGAAPAEPSPRWPEPDEAGPRPSFAEGAQPVTDPTEADEVDRRAPNPPAEEARDRRGTPTAAGDETDEDFSELHDVQDTGTPHYEDLDRLIHELESARIVPRPDFESVPSPNLEDDIEDVVSATLARIYASQGQYDEAARVYEILAGQHPDDADDFLQKASNMRSRASDGETSV